MILTLADRERLRSEIKKIINDAQSDLDRTVWDLTDEQIVDLKDKYTDDLVKVVLDFDPKE